MHPQGISSHLTSLNASQMHSTLQRVFSHRTTNLMAHCEFGAHLDQALIEIDLFMGWRMKKYGNGNKLKKIKLSRVPLTLPMG